MSSTDHDSLSLAGVELGGTKTIVVLKRGGVIAERVRIATTTPDQTLGQVAAQLAAWRFDALGIAGFGPLEIDPASPRFGQLLATPKPGWSGANLIARLAGNGPVALSTDVIAAALAEAETGAAVGCRDLCYVTVGTGIGVGIIAGGAPLTGRLHPEAGHMRVARVPADSFPGTCGFHHDCLEGLASGPAIGARAGRAGAAVSDDDPAWRFVVDALAQGCANLLLTLSSETIVLGGGVIVSRPWLVPAIEARMIAVLAGYLPDVGAGTLRLAKLGEDAGPIGALLLASNALKR
ncbi:MAG: ROK family protein [Sphingomonas bacterium]|nr:ROK family protein [Sphingomonas bacterium]